MDSCFQSCLEELGIFTRVENREPTAILPLLVFSSLLANNAGDKISVKWNREKTGDNVILKVIWQN